MKKRFLRWGLMALSMLWLTAGAQVTINRAEYFYDTDPGLGNGIAITSFTPADSVNLNLSLPTTGLQPGIHNLFIRFRYNNGTWGLQENRQLYVMRPISTAHINKAEYFYDTDPGIGNGVAITVPSSTDSANLNISLPTTGLNTGVHNLFIRFRYDNGTWGLQEGRSFYVITLGNNSNTAKINRAEYFYDTDPGIGSGTAITIASPTDSANLNISLPTTGLATGVHNLFVRFRYDNGTWGLHEGRTFYVIKLGSNSNTAKINQAEYFYDTDPGVGNATAVPVSPATDSANISMAIPTTGLAEGVHNLFFRFRYDNGTWGLQEGRTLYVLPTAGIQNAAKINRAEYFYDNDPGVGNGTDIAVSPASDSVNLTLVLSTSGLGVGFHNLFIRFRYDNGTWGLHEGRPFFVLPALLRNTAHINSAEYFFDNDPGIGRGTQVPVTPATDTANLLLTNVNVTGLQGGSHYLFFRFRYDNGTWGLYEGRAFRICTPPVATITANGPTSYCLGGSVQLSSNTGVTYSYQWQRDGVNITGAKSSTYTAQDTGGSYAIVITDTGGCYGTSNSIVVTVNQKVSSSITRGICTGGSYDFNGTILTTAGVYLDTIPSSAGCDSMITLTLTVSAAINTPVSATICSGETYRFKGQDLTGSGTYRDTITSVGGCDSIVTLTLQVNPGSATPLSASICPGSSYLFNGQQLTVAGTYRDTLSNVIGCDSIVTLTLAVKQASGSTLNIGICTGSTYSFNGQQLAASGTYYDTLTSSNSCDSIITLNLQANSVIINNINASICQGTSYPFKGQQLTAPGTYTDSLIAVGGCDSLVVLALTVNPLPTVTLSGNADTLCSTQSLITLTGGSPSGGTYSGAGVSGTTFNPATAGNGVHVITYTYTDGNTCANTATETIVVNTCTGIGETELEKSILLYPNPAVDELLIQSDLIGKDAAITLFDATGKLVEASYKQQGNKLIFQVSELPAGLYSLRLVIHGEVVNKRFMKAD